MYLPVAAIFTRSLYTVYCSFASFILAVFDLVNNYNSTSTYV